MGLTPSLQSKTPSELQASNELAPLTTASPQESAHTRDTASASPAGHTRTPRTDPSPTPPAAAATPAPPPPATPPAPPPAARVARPASRTPPAAAPPSSGPPTPPPPPPTPPRRRAHQLGPSYVPRPHSNPPRRTYPDAVHPTPSGCDAATRTASVGHD